MTKNVPSAQMDPMKKAPAPMALLYIPETRKKMHSPKQPEIQVMQMDSSHYTLTKQLCTHAFRDEPINVRLNTTIERDSQWVDCVLPHCMNGLSAVAIMGDRIIGAVLCIDEEELEGINLEEFADSPDYGSQIELFDELRVKGNLPTNKKIAHIWMAVCDPEFRNKGLLLHMSATVTLSCLHEGYGMIITEASSKYSYLEAIKNGFKIMASIDYDTWEWKGERVLQLRKDRLYRADTSDHTCVALMAFEISFDMIKEKLQNLKLSKL